MTEEKVEEVLVIDGTALEAFSGLKKAPLAMDSEDIAKVSQVLRGAFFLRREEAEQTPAYKQIIPYLIISSGDKYLTYTRSGSEKRLTDLISIGFGGHINPEDGEGRHWGLIHNSIRREIDEELIYLGPNKEKWDALWGSTYVMGVLYDASTPVGRVHLGVVLVRDIPDTFARCLTMSSEGKNLAWRTRAQLREDQFHLEGWARICFQYLLGGEED